jgi:hypothetical protein
MSHPASLLNKIWVDEFVDIVKKGRERRLAGDWQKLISIVYLYSGTTTVG